MADMAASKAQPEDKRRILEIGEIGLFHAAMPGNTDTCFASYRADMRHARKWLGIRRFVSMVRAARRGDYDLIVVHPPFYPGWHPRSFLAALKFTLFRGNFSDIYGALVSPLMYEALRLVSLPGMIAIDKSDSFGIPRHHHFLFDKVDYYFKRELPVDHWQTLYASAHRRLPGFSFRMKKRWQRRIAKLRPIALGIYADKVEAARAAYGSAKTSDVFFAGAVDGNSTVRGQVPRLVEQLRAAGISVDCPRERLPFDEFIKRCAQSWLTLSPEGLGWDCFRHVEAAIAGSVPLVNAPTIHRYRPLVVGEQCFVYYPDEDNFVARVKGYLADKQRLQRMAASAHEHALAHLTNQAVARALLDMYGKSGQERGRPIADAPHENETTSGDR